jgi:hypothetical protein
MSQKASGVIAIDLFSRSIHLLYEKTSSSQNLVLQRLALLEYQSGSLIYV